MTIADDVFWEKDLNLLLNLPFLADLGNGRTSQICILKTVKAIKKYCALGLNWPNGLR